MIELENTYTFPEQWMGVNFANPSMGVVPIVNAVNPVAMTINVEIWFEVEGEVSGKFWPDINPVPVNNLDYNGGELVARIIDRLNDFKVD